MAGRPGGGSGGGGRPPGGSRKPSGGRVHMPGAGGGFTGAHRGAAPPHRSEPRTVSRELNRPPRTRRGAAPSAFQHPDRPPRYYYRNHPPSRVHRRAARSGCGGGCMMQGLGALTAIGAAIAFFL